jgi:hypothetical protein
VRGNRHLKEGAFRRTLKHRHPNGPDVQRKQKQPAHDLTTRARTVAELNNSLRPSFYIFAGCNRTSFALAHARKTRAGLLAHQGFLPATQPQHPSSSLPGVSPHLLECPLVASPGAAKHTRGSSGGFLGLINSNSPDMNAAKPCSLGDRCILETPGLLLCPLQNPKCAHAALPLSVLLAP